MKKGRKDSLVLYGNTSNSQGKAGKKKKTADQKNPKIPVLLVGTTKCLKELAL